MQNNLIRDKISSQPIDCAIVSMAEVREFNSSLAYMVGTDTYVGLPHM